MKKHWTLSVTVTFVLAFCLLPTSRSFSESDSGQVNTGAGITSSLPRLSDEDSNPVGEPEVFIPEKYRPEQTEAAISVPSGPATLYFTPQDENTSATVLFLYNTSDAAKTVGLQTFQLNGSKHIDTSISVPAHGLVRICSDTVSTVSATWGDVVLVNFTTYSTYAKLTLPAGVKAEGYVVWNDSSVYDPLQVANTLELGFIPDPLSAGLPWLLLLDD
jgi:hypothetical protein